MSEKIQPSHIEREAYVYIRQSLYDPGLLNDRLLLGLKDCSQQHGNPACLLTPARYSTMSTALCMAIRSTFPKLNVTIRTMSGTLDDSSIGLVNTGEWRRTNNIVRTERARCKKD
jgi:hypothetical protein